MTKEEAVALYQSKWWEGRTPEEITGFQLFEERLCMPFGEFHEAVEKALGRPVYTHEFGSVGSDGLRKEFLKEKARPDFAEILALIPAGKAVIVAKV